MAIIDSVKLPDNSTYEVADNYSGYAKKVSSATTDDLASLTATGDLADSGKKLSDLVLKSDVKDVLNSTSTTDPLSANQGRVLNENVEAIVDVYGAKNQLDDDNCFAIDDMDKSGHTFTSNNTDTRSYLNLYIDAWDGATYIQGLVSEIISSTGHYEYSVSIPNNTNRIRVVHNGSQRNIGVSFNTSVTGTCIISLDITGVDPTTAGGLSLGNIMIRDARILDPTFAPYAKTNKQLTKDVSGITNRNFLDNGWFTINQRGQMNYPSNAYTVDRWSNNVSTAIESNTVVKTSSGVTVNNGANAVVSFNQKIENPANLSGKAVTMSAIINNTLYSKTATFSDVRIAVTSDIDFTMSDTLGLVSIEIAGANTVTSIRAVKLEVGSVSTLANDVAPDDAFELAKCRASTADPSDTYANKGNLVNYADLTSLYLTGSTNSTGSTINAGTFFYLNGSYCKALADISNGATFTLNTNFKVANVSDEISEKTLTVTAGTGVTINNSTFKQVGHLIAFSLEFTTSSALSQYEIIATIGGSLTSIIPNYYNVISSAGAKTNYMLYIDVNGNICVNADGLPAGSYFVFGLAFVQ